MSKLIKILAAAMAVFVALLFLLPYLIGAGGFRPLLETRLSAALGRDVKLGDLRLSLISGSLTASDLSIAEDPAFGAGPFLRAQSLGVGVELLEMLFHRRLHVTTLTIERPEIDVKQNPAGVWNFSSLGGHKPAAPAAPAEPGTGLQLAVNQVRIIDGRFSFNKLTLEKVKLSVQDFSANSMFPFKFEASVAGGGEIRLEGKAGPIAADASRTPFDAHLTIGQFNLAGAGLGGQAALDGTAASNGSKVDISGRFQLDRARLVRGGSPAARKLELDCALSHDLATRAGTLARGDIHIGKAVASLTGVYDLAAAQPRVKMKLAGSQMPLDELVAMLPALDIVLPSGSRIQGGAAAIQLATEGALDRLASSGSLSIENTRLAGFDLGKKMETVERLAGIKSGPDTEIQLLSATVRAAPEGMTIEGIKLVVPSIGDLTGGGTIGPAHELAFRMRALVHTGVLMTALGGKSDAGIPFTVGGTAENPVFRPDVKGMAEGQLKAVESNPAGAAKAAEGLVRGLLGRKPK